jgi:hypothetical protein
MMILKALALGELHGLGVSRASSNHEGYIPS